MKNFAPRLGISTDTQIHKVDSRSTRAETELSGGVHPGVRVIAVAVGRRNEGVVVVRGALARSSGRVAPARGLGIGRRGDGTLQKLHRRMVITDVTYVFLVRKRTRARGERGGQGVLWSFAGKVSVLYGQTVVVFGKRKTYLRRDGAVRLDAYEHRRRVFYLASAQLTSCHLHAHDLVRRGGHLMEVVRARLGFGVRSTRGRVEKKTVHVGVARVHRGVLQRDG